MAAVLTVSGLCEPSPLACTTACQAAQASARSKAVALLVSGREEEMNAYVREVVRADRVVGEDS